ncbi:hypothetical protein NPIL_462071 [Nephila pilipes]|uniref:Secreted protein n=1 Tax=Nephila pilipes TaxID=299642 RepID=A0A8X6IT24_NEPPI|nr:hypothetical protein NPIL_462071 [Nephila pilipes]
MNLYLPFTFFLLPFTQQTKLVLKSVQVQKQTREIPQKEPQSQSTSSQVPFTEVRQRYKLIKLTGNKTQKNAFPFRHSVYGRRRNFSEIVCFFCESDTDYHVPPAPPMLAFPPSSQHAPGASAFWQCLDRLPRRQ